MIQKDFNSISLRGRVAYGITCLSKYLAFKYPSTDFSLLLDMACCITEDSNYIDESVMAFTEAIPEYLYEFDNFIDAEFEYLSEDKYNSLIKLVPSGDEDLNIIMHSIRNIVWEYCYVEMEAGAPASNKHIMKIIAILQNHSLEIPCLEKYTKYTFDENDGWGRFIKREEYL